MRTRALVVTTLALAAMLLSPVAAHAEGSATISGVVSDRDHAPVAGTVVSAYSSASRTTRETTVDALGAYTVAADPGKVFVCFEPPAAADVDRECWDDQRFSLDAQAVTVADGEVRTGIDAELDPSSHLRGTVSDERGQPVDGLRFTGFQAIGDLVFSGQVDSTSSAPGAFDLRLPSYGSWKICFSDPQRRYLPGCYLDGQYVDVARATSIDGVDLDVVDATRISGRVTTRDGGPVTGVRVELVGTSYSAAVGRDGRWSFLGPQQGTYRVLVRVPKGRYASQSRTATVTQDGVDVTGVDTVLAVARPLVSRGRPRILGRMVAGNVVAMRGRTWDGPVTSERVTWYVGRRAVRTDARPFQLHLRPWMIGRRVAVVVRATTSVAERSPGVAVSLPRVVRRDPHR